MRMSDELFDSVFLAKLEQLHLLSRKIFRGQHHAERRSRQMGSSLEFADYRTYTRGDDVRAIDWNIYARVERLFIKLFEEEQDLHVFLLIDASASMRWTNGSERRSKFDQARRIAASLGYIALANLDRVNALFFVNGLVDDLGFQRGRGRFHTLLHFLRQPLEPKGVTDLLESFTAFSQREKRRGLVVVLSDFLDTAGWEDALQRLRHQRFDVELVHVLDDEEITPTVSGDVRLDDIESGASMEITADPALLRAYRKTVQDFLDQLDAFALRFGIGLARTKTSEAFEDAVLRTLRTSGMVR